MRNSRIPSPPPGELERAKALSNKIEPAGMYGGFAAVSSEGSLLPVHIVYFSESPSASRADTTTFRS